MTPGAPRRAAVAWRLLLPFAAAACGARPATSAELAAYRAARGALVRAETSAAVARGRYLRQRVRLASSTGLAATGWVLHPAGGARCLAAALLQDGREEDAEVIGRLPAEFGDLVVLSLDYPREMPRAIDLGDALWRTERLRDAARRIPALFLLGAEYLASRADVDDGRIALAATSFAVPFASIAAAADARFANVALVYGAGDLPGVLAANLATRPRALRRPLAALAMRPFADLAPERFIARVAPRPVVMVNGIDDPQMPPAAVRRLYDAARAPKRLVWLRTGHLLPTDSALIRTLVDTAFALLPVLHAPGGGGCAGAPGRAAP